MSAKYSGRWNDLPDDQRSYLSPFAIECHIRHLEQAKRVMIRNHKRALDEINAIIKNCKDGLPK